MRLRNLLTTVLLSSLAAADQIALSSFTPRIDDLPAACDKVYNTPISGCTSQDFQDKSTCSASCISGLVAISKSVAIACSNVDVDETSIIGVFLLGKGIPALCSNTVVTTVGSSSTPEATSTPEAATSASSKSTRAAASSTASIVDPSASTQKSSSTLSTAVKTSVSSAAQSSAAVTSDPAASLATSATLALSSTSTTSSEGAKKTGKQQLSNSASGGGSPFDVQSTGQAPTQAPNGVLALVMGLVAMMLMMR